MSNLRTMSAAAVIVSSLLAGRSGAAEAQLAHMVFFTLGDKTDQAARQLVEGCEQYLSGHEGTVYFSVGIRAEEFTREVNETDFEVALHLVFINKAAHDQYQEHPRHVEFVEKNKHLWSKVRVFDSYLAGPLHDSLPDRAQGFAGTIRGEVLSRHGGRIVVRVAEVTDVWPHNRAEEPGVFVGKAVVISARADEGPVARFVNLLKIGEGVKLDVVHRQGDELVMVELTDEQRERVARGE